MSWVSGCVVRLLQGGHAYICNETSKDQMTVVIFDSVYSVYYCGIIIIHISYIKIFVFF